MGRSERRSFGRVQFERGYTARIMAIDGSWCRECRIEDVSDSGAKVSIGGSIDGLDLREFFLVLTPNATAYRRCERIWVRGDELGVRFLKDFANNQRDMWQRAESQPSRRSGRIALADVLDGLSFAARPKLSCWRPPNCL
jgi:hypothetical protein